MSFCYGNLVILLEFPNRRKEKLEFFLMTNENENQGRRLINAADYEFQILPCSRPTIGI